MRRMGLLIAVAIVVAAAASLGSGWLANGPSVAFSSPADGATVSSPVHLVMKASGLAIEGGGPIHKNAGHFHVMVDVDCFHPGAFVEMHTAGFEHFGDGRTSTELELPPGRHTLCLQVGNSAHVTLRPTKQITITVV